MKLPRFISKLAIRAAAKSLDLPIIPTWMRYNFIAPLFQRLVQDGYKANAAVFAIISAYAFAFPEAPLCVYDANGAPLPNDPLQGLLDRPNDDMDWVEFAAYIITYLAIGGNCYIHKQVNSFGVVKEMYPYHSGQMEAVPSTKEWTAKFRYTADAGVYRDIPKEEVIHLKWPAIDPEKPWLGYAPLLACAREVDTDNEAARYQYALLKNDAVPLTAYSFPKLGPGEEPIGDAAMEKFKAAIMEKAGGAARGTPIVTQGGVTIHRIGLSIKELAMDALRMIPEARMCSVYRIPPIVAGLTSGLDKSTYANFAEARSMWMQDAMMQIWTHVAGAMERGLLDCNDKRHLRFDISKVGALQTDASVLSLRIVSEYTAGLRTRNEARAAINLPPDPDGDTYASAIPTVSDPITPGLIEKASAEAAETSNRAAFQKQQALQQTLGIGDPDNLKKAA